MISCRFVPISCQKGVLFFETPGTCFSKAHQECYGPFSGHSSVYHHCAVSMEECNTHLSVTTAPRQSDKETQQTAYQKTLLTPAC